MASLHHHIEEHLVFAPATQPAYPPSIDLLAQGGWFTKAQKLRLNLHGLFPPLTSMPLPSETVNLLKLRHLDHADDRQPTLFVRFCCPPRVERRGLFRRVGAAEAAGTSRAAI